MISVAKYLSPFKNTKIVSIMESKAVGLKILTTKTNNNNNHSILLQRNQIRSSSYYNYNHPPAAAAVTCFLKTCFLCHKHLSPNKDIYMYRGDQGFCSEECRSRQIYIDDFKQLEISTKKRIQQFRNGGRRCNDRHLSHRKSSMASPIFS